ncbi:DUF4352 domain-containing protein [Jeotgalibacillus campisalis]|uniref:DUF4352 domain-containing protein n=1 Tax=Jeotgalibacillus campisalis TaxID=220754 RepID=A0A0C2SGQ3_9BACL|nr:DUF4352 domain-containing protein [Jeotgalibacillus campisalis]KIL53109.1 hypothetical protein KR50_04380 [Jeotgalibacillus campisalis]
MNKVLKFSLMGCGGLIAVIAILIGIFIILAVFLGSDDTEPVSITQTPQEEPEDEVLVEPEEEITGIGSPLDVEGVIFTINSTSTATNVGGEFGENAKGEYLIIDVTVENNRNESISVDSSFFKLLIDGVEYKADGGAAIYANQDTSFFLESVNPGLSLTGSVPFDAPPGLDISNAQVQVQTGFFGTETGLINLQ